MRTEPKASYRTVQYEYAYRYTPNIYIYIYIKLELPNNKKPKEWSMQYH